MRDQSSSPSPTRGRRRKKNSRNGNTAKDSRSRSPYARNKYYRLPDNVQEHEVHNNYAYPERTAPKAPKPPPIVIYNVTASCFQDYLSGIANIDKNKVQIQIHSGHIKIYASDEEQHNLILDFVKEKKINSYTHRLKSENKTKICLFGLYKMDIAKLEAELRRNNVHPAKIAVIEPKKRDSSGNLVIANSETCIYLLYFDKSSKVKADDLRHSVRGLFNIIIKWKYYTPRYYGPVQCMNCQEYGHGTENCFRPSRCVRCAGKHQSKNCPELLVCKDDGTMVQGTKIPNEKLKCALCGGHHPANFSGCEKRREFESRRLAAADRHKMRRPQYRAHPTDFPGLPKPLPPVGNNSWQNKTHSYAQPTFPSGSSERLFTPNECFQILTDLIEGIENCRTRADQMRLICQIGQRFVQKHEFTK